MSNFNRKAEERNFHCYVEKTRLPGSEKSDNLISFRGKIVPVPAAMDLLAEEFCSAPNAVKAKEILLETYDVYDSYMMPFAQSLYSQNSMDPKTFIACHFLAIENKQYEIDMGDWKVVSFAEESNLENELSFIELHDFWVKARGMLSEYAWNPVKIRSFLRSGLPPKYKKGETWQPAKAPSSQRSKKVSNDSVSAPL